MSKSIDLYMDGFYIDSRFGFDPATCSQRLQGVEI